MIKLRLAVGDDPKMSKRYEWFRDLHGLSHDAAVAHALVRAMAGWNDSVIAEIKRRAAEILRDDFGIDEG